METKKYTLPKDFAEKWVKALRSGEYKQGRGHLFQYETYCCLGVACHIAGVSEQLMIENNDDILTAACFFDTEIPKQLKSNADFCNLLVRLNDTTRKPFPEIADWLEQNVIFV